jgi:hypothetical protein
LFFAEILDVGSTTKMKRLKSNLQEQAAFIRTTATTTTTTTTTKTCQLMVVSNVLFLVHVVVKLYL